MTKGERVVVISKMIKNYVLENYKVDKIDFLNYRGVSNKEFPLILKHLKIGQRIGIRIIPKPKNKIILTLPARITRWKGQEDFISLIKKITEKHPNVYGLIVGDDEKKVKFKEELKEKINNLNLNKNITFVGQRKDIREIISISKNFLIIERARSFWKSVSESLSMGYL